MLKIKESIRERSLVNSFQKYLKEIGAYTIKTSDKFTSGIPDLIIIYKGRTIFVEVKTYKGIVSPIQTYTISQILNHGGESYIIRDLESLKKILDK